MTSPAASASPMGAALTDAAAAALAKTATGSAAARRRRWMRRYLLPTLGGAVILAWLLAAVLAPWITPDGLPTRRGRIGSAPMNWAATC